MINKRLLIKNLLAHNDENTFFDKKRKIDISQKEGKAKFLKKHGKKSAGLFGFNKTLRFKEGIIETNENIAIKGIAEWKSFNQPIEGYSYSKKLTLKGTAKYKKCFEYPFLIIIL